MTAPLDEKAIAQAHEAYAKTTGGRLDGNPMANAIRAYLSAIALPDELGVDWKEGGSLNRLIRALRAPTKAFGVSPVVALSPDFAAEAAAALSQAHSTIAALRAERDELLYLHSERDQGDKIINERLAALEDGVKAVVAERDSWRRVAERLEGEKRAAGGANAPS